MKAESIPGYSIVRQLSGGGMTELYVARDRNDRRVVVRFPKDGYVRDRKLRANFAKAARILQSLDHPNIIRLVDFLEIHRTPVMVLQYVESRTVRDLLIKRDPLLTENGLSLIRQIAAALFHVHHRGFLHLDLKPENLLVEPDGHVWLIDFDLAIERRSKPVKLKQLPGTRAYLAPEAIRERKVDERTDIYSFGMTAYEMMTLHRPFEGETIDQILAAHLDPRLQPTPPRAHNSSIPPALEGLLLKCLAKLPDNRYPSMSLVIKDLEAIV